MSRKVLSAGDITDARCTRCRTVTNHTIVAMVGDEPARVLCNTCGSEHKYHAPRQERAPRTTVASSPSKTPSTARGRTMRANADMQEWLSLQDSYAADKAKIYAMDGLFHIDDVVRHPTFGLGFVRALFKPDKMEVLFQDGRKLLRCRCK